MRSDNVTQQRVLTRGGRIAVRSAAAVLAAALAVTTAGTAAAQDTAPPTDAPLAPGVPAANVGGFTGKVATRLTAATGPVSVFVELTDTPAVDVFSAETARGAAAPVAAAAASEASASSDDTAASVVGELASSGAAPEEIFRTSNAVSGVAVTADAEKVRELAARPDVRAVYPLTPKTVTNSNAAVLTQTLKTWQDTGLLGDDMRVGIIDTGIDYTHADFGGPGTVAAFDAVDERTAVGSGYPTAKVVGGVDFVGNAYDASGDSGKAALEPKPDDNPIDCQSHGSHVSGTAAGFGVNTDGTTFTGDYRTLDAAKLQGMKIGPGMAPNALLYAIKVFGCKGSTNVTSQALDWALDPDGNHNFSDRLDVVNLSLGSDFGAADDPENLFVQKLSENGVLSVFAEGNAGDLYDAGGTPGNSPTALTVASSVDSFVLRDGAEVTAPAEVAGVKGGQYGTDYNLRTQGDLPATPVVALTDRANLDGCKPLSAADAALVAGKVAWLEWDDDNATRKCGSKVRADNAAAAGAAGSVFTSARQQFGARLAGSKLIPVFQLTGTDTTALRPALAAGTLQLSMRNELHASAPTYDDSITDTLSSFSSRGGRGPAVKPDVTAPGDTIASALSGSGDDVLVISGTSMASPHTAGVTTLVRQKHPDWTVEEVKAAVVNTAGTDVSSTPNGAGPFYGPSRQGSGRIDASAATSTNVLAMVADDPGFVSANFGVVEAGGPVTATKTIKVVNKGTTPVTFATSYAPATEQPGVSYSLGKPTVTVGNRGVATVPVTMTIADPTALRKTIDPTMHAKQTGLARQFLADASGNVILTATGGTQGPLRVPVYAAAKPTADIAGQENVTFAAGDGQAPLNLGGRGLDQGTGSEAYASLVSALQLTGSSPQLPPCGDKVVTGCTLNTTAQGGDLRYVGAASTAPLANAAGAPKAALLGFGISTWGSIANLGSVTVPFVDIDVTGDGVADFKTYVDKPADTDVLLVSTVALDPDGTVKTKPDKTPVVVDVQALNGRLGDVDTNVFDTSVMVLPVGIQALGLDPTADSAPITFSVGVSGVYTAPAATSDTIDSLDDMSFDATAPAFSVRGGGDPALTYRSAPGTALVVTRDAETATAERASALLLLHHHNAVGDQAQVVTVTQAAGPVEGQLLRTAYGPTLYAITADGRGGLVHTAITYAQWAARGFDTPGIVETAYVKYAWSPTLYGVPSWPEGPEHDALSGAQWAAAGYPAASETGFIPGSTFYRWSTSTELFVRGADGVLHKLSYPEWAAAGSPAPEVRADQGFIKLAWNGSIGRATSVARGQGSPIGYPTWAAEQFPTPLVAQRFPGDQFTQRAGSAEIVYAGPTLFKALTYSEWVAAGAPAPRPVG